MLPYSIENWYSHCVESEAGENAHGLYQLVCKYLLSDNCFLWMEDLEFHRWDWASIENQLFKWGQKLIIGEARALKTGFLHRIAKKRLEQLRTDAGSSHPKTLAAIAALARNWKLQGCLKEAEQLETQVVEANKDVLGPEHVQTLCSMKCLALTYSYQGRLTEAMEVHLEVIEIVERVARGQETPGLWTALAGWEIQFTLKKKNRETMVKWTQGWWNETAKLYFQMVEMAEEALGPKNLHTVIIMAQLAYISYVQGQEIGAVFLMRRILSLQDEVLGSEHPHTIHNRAILDEWETALCKNSSCAVPFRRRHEG
jgi:Tetratricopeptide repeat